MGIREALLWPVARIAAWVDDNPLIAAGAVVETALAQPAYPVVALVGLVVFALYDG